MPEADAGPRHCGATLINLGLPRTGTTSLHLALGRLGLHSLHAADLPAQQLADLSSAVLADWADLRAPPVGDALERYDAVGCAPWFALSPAALQEARRGPAPPLKLLATTRAPASWLRSISWLVSDPLFAAHPQPVLQLMRRQFGLPASDTTDAAARLPFEPRSFARAFTRHTAMLRALNATLIDLRQPDTERWRQLCSLILAPPRCTTGLLRSMADCPLNSSWPHRSERYNRLEVFGISRAQVSPL